MDHSERHQLDFDQGYFDKLRPKWEAMVPALAGLQISQAWAAAVDCTPDALPILDEPRPGFFVLAAGSHGIMNGPALAEKLAERMLLNQCNTAKVISAAVFCTPARALVRVSLSPSHMWM